jgi:hypothetical protein
MPGLPHTQMITPCEMPVVGIEKEDLGPVASIQIVRSENFARAITTEVETYE